MRLKGINPFEQHVEKAVVVVVGAVALGILAWQFIGPPNTVRVKNNPVPIDMAYVQLQSDADNVQAKLRAESFEGMELPPMSMIDTFNQRRTGSVARARALAWAGEALAPIFSGETDLPTTTRYAVQALVAPAPAAPVAATYLATISPAEVEANPALAALLPRTMPFDKAAVSIETTYDGAALGRVLAADPDGEGDLVALPRHWWDGLVQILAVELEREELQPDGSWSNLTTVPAMPGRFSLNEQVDAGITNLTALTELASDATRYAASIRRPQYYAIVFGDEWVPPSEIRVEVRPQNQAEIIRATREHDDAVQRIARLEEQLNQIAGEDAQAQNQRQGIQRSINVQTTRRDRARDELRRLGAPVAGDVVAVDPADPLEVTEPALMSDSAVRLWNHDLTAERGKTYRYRVVLVLPNPIFGQSAAIRSDLSSLASQPFVRTEPSPWGEPIAVDPETYYWITSAQDQPAGAAIGGGPRAAAEIYVFSWGYWRKGSALLEPGDPVAGRVRVPDFAAMRPDLMNVPGGQNPDGFGQAPAVDPDAVVTPIYTELTVARDAYLLDVAAVPAVRERGVAGQAQFQAFLRDSNGSIVARSPESERQSMAYQRVARSASLGEQALRPKPVVREPTRPGPERPGRDEGPAGKPGGGGGGG